jgi:hypothetical protein
MFNDIKTKLIAALVGVVIFGASVTGAYFYGRSDEAAHCTADGLTDYKEGVERNEAIDNGTMGMDVPSLDRALSHWLRHE